MRYLIILPFLAFSNPAFAQDSEGSDLMQRGAELFFRGLQSELEPAFDEWMGLVDDLGPELRGFVAQMGPALADVLGQVEDWSTYDMPEILPNGDIIIRKKQAPGVNATDL